MKNYVICLLVVLNASASFGSKFSEEISWASTRSWFVPATSNSKEELDKLIKQSERFSQCQSTNKELNEMVSKLLPKGYTSEDVYVKMRSTYAPQPGGYVENPSNDLYSGAFLYCYNYFVSNSPKVRLVYKSTPWVKLYGKNAVNQCDILKDKITKEEPRLLYMQDFIDRKGGYWQGPSKCKVEYAVIQVIE